MPRLIGATTCFLESVTLPGDSAENWVVPIALPVARPLSSGNRRELPPAELYTKCKVIEAKLQRSVFRPPGCRSRSSASREDDTSGFLFPPPADSAKDPVP